MRRRLPVVGLLAVVSFAALALGQAPPLGFVPAEQTECYTCHATWTPPLRQIAALTPPQEAGMAVGGAPLDYSVSVGNAWIAELVFLAPTLDLSGAPSLAFADTQDDILGLVQPITVVLNPANLTGTQSQSTVYAVPEGASKVSFRLEPKAGSGGTQVAYTMVVAPPTGPPRRVPGQAGQPTEATFGAADLAAIGAGNWTVGAEVRFFDAGNPAGASPFVEARFDAVGDVLFDSEGRERTLARRVSVPKGSATLVSWPLLAIAAPQAGETVRIALNSTAFYEHINRGYPDFGNFTQSTEATVSQEGDLVVLRSAGAITVRPAPVNGPTLVTVSEVVGYAAAFLLVSSIASGGMFGKASRRQLNHLFGSAKRRVAFHNFLSYGLTAAAGAHTVLFLVEAFYSWTLGIIWGGLALLAMTGLGVTGALQVPMIRRWSYATWRWTHYGMAVATILFTVVHGLLDGVHFGELQAALGWDDPLNPDDDLL